MTRTKAIGLLSGLMFKGKLKEALDMAIKALEQEPQSFKWCTDCKEYDQEKHCCHRWSKVIRDTVEEMKQEPILDKIRAEIEYAMKYQYAIGEDEYAEGFEKSLEIIDKYKAESEPQESDIEKRKPCINYEDGCEEWAGCPCVYYKSESEDKE